MRAHRLAVLAICAAPLFAACAVVAYVPSTDSASPAVVTSAPASRIGPGPAPSFPATALPGSPDIRKALDAAAFVSPSGQIVCQLLASGARCDYFARDKAWDAPEPGNCDLSWGWSLYVDRTAGTSCVGDTIVTRAAVDSGFDTWRKPADPTVDWNGIALAVLPYGSTLLVNTFRCDSATTGVTCQNQSTGHGFFMSRESYRFF
jgi:hypothetical protein